MSRPLMQLGIIELESLFTKSGKDMQVLRNLESELQHRQVPRARSLLTSVQKAMKEMNASVLADPPEPTAVDRPPTATTRPMAGLFNPVCSVQPEIKSPAPVEAMKANQTREEGAVVPLSEAYRLLKANPGSSWASIEMLRRQLVQEASPAVAPREQRLRLQEEANRINLAYRTIAHARAQGQ